jgi:hypothetical protein
MLQTPEPSKIANSPIAVHEQSSLSCSEECPVPLCVDVDQTRTDFAAIESELEVIQKQLSRLPTRRELPGTALGISSRR